MAATNLGTKTECLGLEIELLNPACARIRSHWPVTSPRGDTSLATKLLNKTLEEGVVVTHDTERASFFEVDVGHAWFYFHIAYKLGRIYLVAALIR
jgi:hypothetical protein